MKKQFDSVGIVFAGGGSSQRFGESNKLLMELAGIPLFLHSIITFSRICHDKNMVVVVPENELEQFALCVKRHTNFKNIIFIAGGDTRAESVEYGLRAIHQSIDYIAIHDLARPLASSKMLYNAIARVVENQTGAIIAQRMVNTVKRSDCHNVICETLNRDNLWSIETPQLFHKDKLMNAYGILDKQLKQKVTDDAGIMEYAGHKIELVESTEFNLKVTYPQDFQLAELFIKAYSTV
jgi:2-C-methyl-D-erythritol 4-phosphate cytidylyltransferase